MTAKILDGNKMSNQILEEVRQECLNLKYKGIIPGLAVILVGDNPASQLYVNLKNKKAKEVGIYSEQINFPEDVKEEILLEKIDELNKNPKINGLLVQLPLPKHISRGRVISKINPEKDVDGFTVKNFGKLLIARERLVPCTPKGIICLLRRNSIEIEGKDVCIIGASNIVGKPLALMMLNRGATTDICHLKTKDLKKHTKQADIIAVGVGKPNLITKDMVKEGAIVIDIGINKIGDKTVGDVADDVKEVAGYITPVPGGVGPMTVACLMENTVLAAKLQNDLGAEIEKTCFGCACEYKRQ